MVDRPLAEARRRLESLADDGGRYYLACARTGERPVPAADLRFPDRTTARAAAVTTTRYRATLRRFDARVPRYDVVVHERTVGDLSGEGNPDRPTSVANR